ncbi:MAG: CHRD domain-containing protein [Thermoleophilia bacterium]|nr:CHRD domain-containing protein [Thermoleophilia bacterium]
MTKLLLLTVLVLGLSAGCGGDDGDEAGGGDAVTVELAAQNDSGESGTATLTPEGDQTRVVLELSNPTDPSQPAHIHPGTCANLDPAPAYPLPNVEEGRSEATVDVALEELTGGEFAVNVHKSNEEASVYVACGDLD